jgi:hypothetical protein
VAAAPKKLPARTRILASLSLTLLLAAPAGARSWFLLAYPERFGPQPAATYDGSGARIGAANLFIEQLPSGRVRLQTESGRRSGARTIATAELAPVVPGKSLRLVGQESRSVDENGEPLGVMRIDHLAGIARCLDRRGDTISEMRLPSEDRVVNVPLNLFFLPLATGEVDSLDFQLFLCRPDARLIDFEAWIEGGRGDSIEVRYAPDFGFVSPLARTLVPIPKLSVWFDPTAPHAWQAHRLPLYSGGPEVFVVRDDVSSAGLVVED